MQITPIADKALPPQARRAIGRYRHQVFIQSLQWDLPTDGQHEHDEFDVASATHLLAQDDEAELIGYARLLPTTEAYLLGTHFSHLIEGGVAPSSPFVWELSRYAACAVNQPAASAAQQTRVGKKLLLEAVRFVALHGGDEIVFCTTVAVERLAVRWGVDIERMGAAQHDGQNWLVAARIHCNDRTYAALLEKRAPVLRPRQPACAPAPLSNPTPELALA